MKPLTTYRYYTSIIVLIDGLGSIVILTRAGVPVCPNSGGGSAKGDEAERRRFLLQVRKSCGIASKLREIGIRKYGVIRIDSAASAEEWAKNPAAHTKQIAQTFREGCAIAEDHG